ncbi:PREDICTED: receptor-like protein 12 [Populus euphratica]|uniref:Receptor-like protein 12 n=1 Tax=Populus euphratica TaxID=75702 RepID=A0AAJ6UZL6_POPEU|nr:PREDICTED: receptor-like protein 12 [Populus euphratica]
MSFMNHSKLKLFICDHNTLIGDKAGFQNFIPKFLLMLFSLSYSTSKALNADVPNFLYNQYDLRNLDLSNNNFSGMFPSWLLENNTSLEAIYLRQNSFVGPLKLPNHPNPNMITIDISNSNIHGQVALLLVPIVVTSEQHELPPPIFNSSAFLYLYLDGNNFTGQISGFPPPNWIHLSALDISNNQLSGMLPTWMGNVSYPQAIDLSRNHFEGPIPRDFCDLGNLKYLDMSENYLFGSVPSCFSPSTIKHVHLSKNQLSGPLTNAFYNSSSLVTLDLNYNNFMGPISNWFGNLSVLSVLLLKANHFAGEFPTRLCLLEHLSILDVSQNKLSGLLPSCIENYPFKQNLEKAVAVHQRIYQLESTSKMYSETSLLLGRIDNLKNSFRFVNIEETIEFTTKRMSYGYKGNILNFMTGFDLSSNRFSGEIPLVMGNLRELHALNLSHNNLKLKADRELGSLLQQLEWWNPSRTCCPQQSSSFQCGTQ